MQLKTAFVAFTFRSSTVQCPRSLPNVKPRGEIAVSLCSSTLHLGVVGSEQSNRIDRLAKYFRAHPFKNAADLGKFSPREAVILTRLVVDVGRSNAGRDRFARKRFTTR